MKHLVKCGVLIVQPTAGNSSLKVIPLSARIQSPIEIFLIKNGIKTIQLIQPTDKNITAPDGVILIKQLAVLLRL